MKFELPALPYSLDALQPHMSRETLEYHYGKHLQTYINNLNSLIEGTKYESIPLEEIVKNSEGPVFNNAAQTWNHLFFFFSLSPEGPRQPQGRLSEAIDRDFGSFSDFKDQFSKVAAGIFGSGWAWLSADANGKLIITSESNAGNPMTKGLKPLMTCDVWEHAYYIDYRNRRPDFISNFWSLLDWNAVDKQYK